MYKTYENDFEIGSYKQNKNLQNIVCNKMLNGIKTNYSTQQKYLKNKNSL